MDRGDEWLVSQNHPRWMKEEEEEEEEEEGDFAG